MTRLFRSALHPNQWIAYVEGYGWLSFPERENGWELRRQARGLDPLHLREVPAHLAAKSGFPETAPDLSKVA